MVDTIGVAPIGLRRKRDSKYAVVRYARRSKGGDWAGLHPLRESTDELTGKTQHEVGGEGIQHGSVGGTRPCKSTHTPAKAPNRAGGLNKTIRPHTHRTKSMNRLKYQETKHKNSHALATTGRG